MTGGTQSSAMEVDEEGEDEVVVVEEAKRGEMRKRAPLSLPKSLRKRVRAGTVTQTLAGMGTVGSMGGPRWRCIRHGVQCIVLSGRAQCENYQVKHYGCLLVPPKEVVGGKGGPLGSQKVKVAEGSQQAKGQARKA